MKGYTTRVIHTRPGKKDPHGALNYPVYDGVAYEFENSEDLALAFEGKKPAHVYSRSTNPTIQYFEERVRSVVNAKGVIAMSSGMAVITNLILAVCKSGDSIITSKNLFGNTYSLFAQTLKPWGLNVKFADLANKDEIESLIDDSVRLIYFETITNPQLVVADTDLLSDIAKKHNLLLVSDSTLTPLIFGDLKNAGVNIELISSTKYISGGGTSVGGILIDHGNYQWNKNPNLADLAKKMGPFALITKLRKETYRNIGSCMSSHNASLQSLGLETLALRVERSCSNALEIAKYLESHELIKTVNYPGLQSSAYYNVTKKQYGNKAGGIVTFNLSSKKDCFKFMDNLNIIRRATNLNDNKSLIIHPSSTIYCEYTEEDKIAMGVPDTLIRLAVGIEDAIDLIDDIKQALEAL